LRTGTNQPAKARARREQKDKQLRKLVGEEPEVPKSVPAGLTTVLHYFKRNGSLHPNARVCCLACLRTTNATSKILSRAMERKLIQILLNRGCVETHPGPTKNKGPMAKGTNPPPKESTRVPLDPELLKKLDAERSKYQRRAEKAALAEAASQHFEACVIPDPFDDLEAMFYTGPPEVASPPSAPNSPILSPPPPTASTSAPPADDLGPPTTTTTTT
jgi:hypothetical protein